MANHSQRYKITYTDGTSTYQTAKPCLAAVPSNIQSITDCVTIIDPYAVTGQKIICDDKVIWSNKSKEEGWNTRLLKRLRA